MNNRIYCIYDDLGQRFGQVYCCATDGVAQLEISKYFQAQNNGVIDESATKENYARYHLYRIGDIDIESGVVSPCVPPCRLSWQQSVLESESSVEPTTMPLAN